MDELSAIAARVNGGSTVAELLDAAFDAFEFLRLVARACEDRAPELFAAFMLAAGSAAAPWRRQRHAAWHRQQHYEGVPGHQGEAAGGQACAGGIAWTSAAVPRAAVLLAPAAQPGRFPASQGQRPAGATPAAATSNLTTFCDQRPRRGARADRRPGSRARHGMFPWLASSWQAPPAGAWRLPPSPWR